MLDQDARFVEREDWFIRAVIAGFIATVTMTIVLLVAYGVALALGSPGPGAGILANWFWGLTHNVVTSAAGTALPLAALLDSVFGIIWAVVYARLAEPHLSGPGWKRGLIFSPLPGLLSLLVFLPAVGGGILGLGLGAGPLPIIGNLLVHAVYGVTLGYLYLPQHSHLLVPDGEEENPEEIMLAHRGERTMAFGIIVGLVLGAIVGLIAGDVAGAGQGALLGILVGAAGGSAIGLFIGSYSGLAGAA
jgi:hypothetical protein